MKRMTWPVGVLDLLEDGLEALLELAAVLGAGDERAQVERDDALVLERLGHVAAHDALGQALHDGGLADAGLADQDGVVLRPRGEDLDDPADLLVAADDRVELAGPRLGRQVAAVLLQGLVGRSRGSGWSRAGRRARSPSAWSSASLAGAGRVQQPLGLAADSLAAISRCSVETYSSLRRRASSSARCTAAGPAARGSSAAPRRARGGLRARGQVHAQRAARRRRAAAGSRRARRRRSSSAARRCSASSIGLCASVARRWAARMASWAFWV